MSVPAAASSSLRGPAPAAPEIVPAAVVWDHRAMGNDLVVRCLGVPLRIPFGGTGMYEFDCAPWLAATAPAAWHDALRPLLPASGERGRGAGGSTQHG